MMTMPASALASALALAPAAVAMMATARCPFDQEVEDRGAELCVTMTTGGGIADRTTLMMTMAPTSALALASAPAVAAMMAIACHPFAQEVEDCGAEPRVTTTSHVSRDKYE